MKYSNINNFIKCLTSIPVIGCCAQSNESEDILIFNFYKVNRDRSRELIFSGDNKIIQNSTEKQLRLLLQLFVRDIRIEMIKDNIRPEKLRTAFENF